MGEAISASMSVQQGDVNCGGLDGASTFGVRVRRAGAGALCAETSSSLNSCYSDFEHRDNMRCTIGISSKITTRVTM